MGGLRAAAALILLGVALRLHAEPPPPVPAATPAAPSPLALGPPETVVGPAWRRLHVDPAALTFPWLARLARAVAPGTRDARLLRAFGRLDTRYWPYRTHPPADFQARALAAQAALGWAAGGKPPLLQPLGRLAERSDGWQPVGECTIPPGRMTDLVVQPAGASYRVWAAAAAGGVWRVDGTTERWRPIADRADALTIGAIALAPGGSGELLAGTGEGNYGDDNRVGRGIQRRPAAQAAWTPEPLWGDGLGGVHQVAFDPLAPARQWAATTRGLFQRPAGGTAWVRLPEFGERDVSAVLPSPAAGLPALVAVGSGLEAQPDDLASGVAGTGVYRSASGASGTWARVTAIVTDGSSGRIHLARSAVDPALVLAAVVGHKAAPPGQRGRLRTLHLSRDGGLGWEPIALPADPSALCTGFCYYAFALVFDGADADLAYLAGDQVSRVRLSDATWTPLGGSWVPDGGAFLDVHALASPARGVLFAASDGGVTWTQDAAVATTPSPPAWSPVGSCLATTQFYHLSTDPAGGESAIGGTQDRGLLRYEPGGEWDRLLASGDGGQTASRVDAHGLSHFGGSTMVCKVFGFPATGPEFPALPATVPAALASCGGPAPPFPLLLDRVDPARLLVAHDQVYRSDGGTLAGLGPVLDPGHERILALAQSPPNPGRLWVGTDRGRVFLQRRHILLPWRWHWRSCSPLPVAAAVTSIAADPRRPATAWLTLGGYGHPHVWRTDDECRTWQAVATGLPDLPFNHVLAPEQEPGLLLAAADLGVYRSSDRGATWVNAAPGLPNAPMNWLSHGGPGRRLRVASHGRGVWELLPLD